MCWNNFSVFQKRCSVYSNSSERETFVSRCYWNNLIDLDFIFHFTSLEVTNHINCVQNIKKKIRTLNQLISFQNYNIRIFRKNVDSCMCTTPKVVFRWNKKKPSAETVDFVWHGTANTSFLKHIINTLNYIMWVYSTSLRIHFQLCWNIEHRSAIIVAPKID